MGAISYLFDSNRHLCPELVFTVSVVVGCPGFVGGSVLMQQAATDFFLCRKRGRF
jgi:hypothetical protein